MKENITCKPIYRLKKLTKEQLQYSETLKKTGIHPVMADLYVLREIKDSNDINLAQKLESFTNMKGIKEATQILTQAIFKKEKICVIADYDADGATACAIAVRGLKMFGANVDYIVPNRFIHGYGLTPSVVDEAIKTKNPNLLITVDNGIASVEGVDYANKKGLKVLITDHHLPGDTLPKALCIVNPNQPGCEFKSKYIAGCGVIFYVLAALRQYMIDLGVYTSQTAPNVFSLLDLVAIGTIADLVKLDLNNRIIVNLGLRLIRKGQTRPGILAIINVAKSNYKQLKTTDIEFKLAPRINAAGRLEDMTIGINCLLTDDINTARKFAEQLNEINVNRKKIENEMQKQALELPPLKETRYSKVVFDESFHEGVIGIVASKIKELFYRPTIVFAPANEDNLIKGSGRSISEVHLKDALDYVYKKRPDIIKKFGGHAMAAGLTIEKKFLHDFCDLFEEAIKHFVGTKELQNIKEIDLDLSSKYITIETAENIFNEIWGHGFPQPLFVGKFKILDQKILKETNLKLLLEKDGKIFDGIWFNNNNLLKIDVVNLVYSLDINDFNNQKKIQLIIDGIFDN